MVVTRFAPSPTGFLHIGGARTALFNWLYARHAGGRFLLRIEDTDRARATAGAVEAIFRGLRWLGLDWDGEPLFQSRRADRHRDIAERLLSEGKAYRCWCTAGELAEQRDAARAAGRPVRYDGRCRDRDPADAPAGVDPAVRLRAPLDGDTVIADLVQGEVRFAAKQLDDMVLLRGNGTPTYMLAVVADDHDMGITHVIRGVDHLTNAARQTQLFAALGWTVPAFAHIPLIHGADGAKLSKRHGAMAADEYQHMGVLPEAMRNYLARLGWAHGDDEIFSTEQAVAWFGLEAVGRSPARFDLDKLYSLNRHYLQSADPDRLLDLIEPALTAASDGPLAGAQRQRVRKLLPEMTRRTKDLVELSESAAFLVAARPIVPDPGAAKLLAPAGDLLSRLAAALAAVTPWEAAALETAVRTLAEAEDRRLGAVAQPLRAALTGRAVSPGIFDVLAALGRDESLARLQDAVSGAAAPARPQPDNETAGTGAPGAQGGP